MIKIANNSQAQLCYSTAYGLRINAIAGAEASYHWGNANIPVLKAVDIGSIEGWHTARIRRIGDTTSVWVDDVRLTTDGAPYNDINDEAATMDGTYYNYRDRLIVFKGYYTWNLTDGIGIDWFFVRTAVANEPTATVLQSP